MPTSTGEGKGIQFQLKRVHDPLNRCYDLEILEYFFHMTIKLRLANENEQALKQALEYSTMISKLIGILLVKFDGRIPLDDVSEARKLMAKFVGLAFFKVHRECLMKDIGSGMAGNRSCCRKHQIEGLREGHGMFLKLLEPYKINIDHPLDLSSDAVDDHLKAFLITFFAVFIELKTQIIVGELGLLTKSGDENLSQHLETLMETLFRDSLEIPYMRNKLQGRAIQLRAIIDQYDLEQIPAELEAKFSFDLFEDNLRCFLRCLYASYPKCELIEEKIVTVMQKEQESNSIMQESVRETVNEQSCDMEPFEELEPLKTKVDHSTHQVTGSINRDQEKVQQSEGAPSVVSTSPFSGVIISGRFFRGVLESNDDRFAAIVEARDINVKQYLLQRKRKAASLAVRSTVSSSKKKPSTTAAKGSVSASSLVQNEKASLLERHNSAERIGWETQETKTFGGRFEHDEDQIYSATNPQQPEPPTTISHRKNMTQSKTSKDSTGTPKIVRGRRRYDDEEVKNLIEGIRRFGKDWRRIQNSYNFHDRTNVDLKDKARNLAKLGLI